MVGGLFYAYLLQSRVLPTDADGAGNALQAWDMLHGNVLLSGWSLSDVSFYTTELPEYMLVELVRGLNAYVVHVAAAITYTLVGVLAIGRATGREAAVRALVVAAIMLATALGTASSVLLLSPDHVGTSVSLLLILLVLDRAKPRWYVPAVIAALVAWAELADLLVVLVGAIRWRWWPPFGCAHRGQPGRVYLQRHDIRRRLRPGACRGAPARRGPGRPAHSPAPDRRQARPRGPGGLPRLAGILAYNAGRPPSPAAAQNVADWLAARHLSYGLGGYWQANRVDRVAAAA